MEKLINLLKNKEFTKVSFLLGADAGTSAAMPNLRSGGWFI